MILDLVVTDEFSEPFHYASRPVKLQVGSLFDDELSYDSSDGDPYHLIYQCAVLDLLVQFKHCP